MSGHSKWSKIKRQKGVTDVKKGQLFTKLGRELMVAVREGGSDPDHNFRLRLAIQKCRDNNMPMDNVNTAIKRASGEGGTTQLTEATFEGYGPSGTAILVQALTDGGNLADAGGVAWLFESKGVITLETNADNAEEVALMAIDAGAEDVRIEKDFTEVYTHPQMLEAVRRSLDNTKVRVAAAELSMIPKTMVGLDEEEALRAVRLLDRLEELDDVQRVFSNVDFSDAVMEKIRVKA